MVVVGGGDRAHSNELNKNWRRNDKIPEVCPVYERYGGYIKATSNIKRSLRLFVLLNTFCVRRSNARLCVCVPIKPIQYFAFSLCYCCWLLSSPVLLLLFNRRFLWTNSVCRKIEIESWDFENAFGHAHRPSALCGRLRASAHLSQCDCTFVCRTSSTVGGRKRTEQGIPCAI